MDERLETLYGRAIRTLARREGHRAVLPRFLGGDAQRDLAAQRRAQTRAAILRVLPGTVDEIARRTDLSVSATRDNLRGLSARGEVASKYLGSVKIWRRV